MLQISIPLMFLLPSLSHSSFESYFTFSQSDCLYVCLGGRSMVCLTTCLCCFLPLSPHLLFQLHSTCTDVDPIWKCCAHASHVRFIENQPTISGSTSQSGPITTIKIVWNHIFSYFMRDSGGLFRTDAVRGQKFTLYHLFPQQHYLN